MSAQTMRAAIVQEDRTVKTGQRPIPKLKEKDVLIKIAAFGQNPTDYSN